MVRNLLSALVLLICSVAALSAQNTPPVWGLKASVSLELPGNWRGNGHSFRMFNNGTDVTAGAVCNIYLGRNFYLEPGLALFYQSYSYDDLTIDTESEPIFNPSLYKLGFEVPVVAGYSFGISDRLAINVFTGPQLRLSAAGKIRLSEKALLEGADFNLWDTQRRFEVDWTIGAGCQVDRVMVALEGDLGLNDLLKSPATMSFRQNRLTLSLTYYL